MRILLLLFLTACGNSDQSSPDLAVMGTCPAMTACNAADKCIIPGFEPETCTCVTPERVSCCTVGAGLDCGNARQGEVCCGFTPGGTCGNLCRCTNNHWDCPDGGQ